MKTDQFLKKTHKTETLKVTLVFKAQFFFQSIIETK